MKKTVLLAIALLSFWWCEAQQTGLFGQAAESFGLYNPAGLAFEEMRHDGTIFNLHSRNQWWNQNLPGQPKTQTLTWLENQQKQLFGIRLNTDQIGETNRVGVAGRYAHAAGEGLKIGVGAGIYSNNTNVEKLYIYDLDDEVAMQAGETRLQLEASAGLFYHFFDPNRAWQWFAGASFRRLFFITPLAGSEGSTPETDLQLQGGISREKWLIAGQARISFQQPSAADFYLRRYFAGETVFLGLLATSDLRHHTAGVQAGYEWPLKSGGKQNNHYLNFSLGMSKPLSQYIDGNNLIVDFRVVWLWGHGKK